MFLFIFESIGTSELILVGIIALIFLGPRKLPEIARKIGKVMAEFRGTANEFKETWQREVDFEEEAKAFDVDTFDPETISPSEATHNPEGSGDLPAVREIDPSTLQHLRHDAQHIDPASASLSEPSDKENWL